MWWSVGEWLKEVLEKEEEDECSCLNNNYCECGNQKLDEQDFCGECI